MIFSSRSFLQKKDEQILLYYYETSGRLVFVRFFGGNWRHQKDISKLTDLYTAQWRRKKFRIWVDKQWIGNPKMTPKFSILWFARNLMDIGHPALQISTGKFLSKFSYVQYALWQYGCGVFKRGVQNQKDFCLRINILRGNYWILRIGLMGRCQKLDIILVSKVI